MEKNIKNLSYEEAFKLLYQNTETARKLKKRGFNVYYYDILDNKLHCSYKVGKRTKFKSVRVKKREKEILEEFLRIDILFFNEVLNDKEKQKHIEFFLKELEKIK